MVLTWQILCNVADYLPPYLVERLDVTGRLQMSLQNHARRRSMVFYNDEALSFSVFKKVVRMSSFGRYDTSKGCYILLFQG